jgi:hypothetical protein
MGSIFLWYLGNKKMASRDNSHLSKPSTSKPVKNVSSEEVKVLENNSKNNSALMALTNENERTELKEFISEHPDVSKMLETPENLCHALKVIASIKPNERFSTSTGIYVQSNEESWTWFRRWVYGDDRASNMKAIKIIFVATFVTIDRCVLEREEFMKKAGNDLGRVEVIQRMKNAQLIERITQSVVDAKHSLQNLKKTYREDTHTCARIDMLSDSIKDRLQLIKTSLQFLDAGDLLAKPLFRDIDKLMETRDVEEVPQDDKEPSSEKGQDDQAEFQTESLESTPESQQSSRRRKRRMMNE